MHINITDSLPLPGCSVTVLLVSADRSDRASLQSIMARTLWNLQVRTNCRDGLTALRQKGIPVVICDAGKKINGDWRSLLDGMAHLPTPPKLIVSSRLADERLWAEV